MSKLKKQTRSTINKRVGTGGKEFLFQSTEGHIFFKGLSPELIYVTLFWFGFYEIVPFRIGIFDNPLWWEFKKMVGKFSCVVKKNNSFLIVSLISKSIKHNYPLSFNKNSKQLYLNIFYMLTKIE